MSSQKSPFEDEISLSKIAAILCAWLNGKVLLVQAANGMQMFATVALSSTAQASSFKSASRKKAANVFENEGRECTHQGERRPPFLPSCSRSLTRRFVCTQLLGSPHEDSSFSRYANAVCCSKLTACYVRVVPRVESNPTDNPLAILESLSPGVMFGGR